MSQYNRKGYTTVKAKDKNGGIHNVAVPKDGKLARIARHKNKQMDRARKQHIKDYKAKLCEAKKKVPLAERSHISLQDL